MATYYVSPYGLDANNGLGSDPAHATNKPWLTIGKALGAAGIASGDIVKICPGTYRESVTAAMVSATVETKLTGDVENASGFKDSGGVLVPGGRIIWSSYTTNDKTAPAAGATLITSQRDFLTFENIYFMGGNTDPSCVKADVANSTNIKFTNCVFVVGSQTGSAISYTGTANIASNWTIDRCTFLVSAGHGFLITLPQHTADYDSNFTIQNCLILVRGGSGIRILNSGAGGFFSGGVDVRNCTIMAGTSGVLTFNAMSTTIPCTVYNCIILAATPVQANALGQILEDYNILYGTTPRTNTDIGANSQSSATSLQYALMLGLNDFMFTGAFTRPFFEPIAGSPLLGFGNQASSPSVDAWNRRRPSGGLSGSPGIGYLERHNTFGKETGTTDAGGVGWSVIGPADQDIHIPVDAVSTTISIKMRYDGTYAGGVLPQAILLANGEIGVVTETKTMVAAANTWETLTFTAFTPSAKGVVTIRLVSRDTSATGKCFADTLVVT